MLRSHHPNDLIDDTRTTQDAPTLSLPMSKNEMVNTLNLEHLQEPQRQYGVY